jgi:hypothetical protein
MMNKVKCHYCAALANTLIAKDTKKVVPQNVCSSCARAKRGSGFEVVARLKDLVALAA